MDFRNVLKMISHLWVILAAGHLLLFECAKGQDLFITEAHQIVDLSSRIVRVNSEFRLRNERNETATQFLFFVESAFANKIAHLEVKVKGEDELLRTEIDLSRNERDKWFVYLTDPLEPRGVVAINVFYEIIHTLTHDKDILFPEEKQTLVYTGFKKFYSAYPVASSIVQYDLGPSKLVNITSDDEPIIETKTLTYGPYFNVKPFDHSEVIFKYENDSPSLVVTQFMRTISISYEQGIEVVDDVTIENSAAAFSVFRGEAGFVVSSFYTLLPHDAFRVRWGGGFFKGEILNDEFLRFHCPHCKGLSSEYKILRIEPDTPLQGGSDVKYSVRYYLPTSLVDYKDSIYTLKVNSSVAILSDVVVSKMIVTIILPEGSTTYRLANQTGVERLPNSMLQHPYFNALSRTVISMKKENFTQSSTLPIMLEYVDDITYTQWDTLCMVFLGVLFIGFCAHFKYFRKNFKKFFRAVDYYLCRRRVYIIQRIKHRCLNEIKFYFRTTGEILSESDFEYHMDRIGAILLSEVSELESLKEKFQVPKRAPVFSNHLWNIVGFDRLLIHTLKQQMRLYYDAYIAKSIPMDDVELEMAIFEIKKGWLLKMMDFEVEQIKCL